MRSQEFTGKTTQEAIDAGLAALGVTIADVHVDVIQEGAKGLFGLFGSKPACVRLTVMEEEKEDDHGLGDLLMKHYSGTLNATIDAVIGNYDVLRDLVERFDVPFELVSHEGLSREEHCHKVLEAVQKYSPDYVVLAKYMRIITPELLQAFRNRVINIHHSSCRHSSARSPISRPLTAA